MMTEDVIGDPFPVRADDVHANNQGSREAHYQEPVLAIPCRAFH